jgi:Animal haem peroxidase
MPGLAIGHSHGGVRGAGQMTRSPLFEGRFGRMFRRLSPAIFSEAALHELATVMIAEAEAEPTPETEVDDEENQGIAAGFTYLGQFIDHDLTFDPASSLMKQNDPDALVDFRNPQFDLDNVYGRGPDDQPYLYEADGRHLQLGRRLTGNPADPNTRDVPRHTSDTGGTNARARALIGDPRNDENVIVSQLQAVMLRFHNKLADEHPKESFTTVQQLVRWHYQWVVLHDFLTTIVGLEMVQSILPHLKSGKSIFDDKPQLRFYQWRHNPFIPIEFSAAAYRFGHSMVRPIYRLNTTLGNDPPPPTDPVNGRQFIFHPDDDAQSLNGFRAFPSIWAIEWNLFFDFGDRLPNVGVKRLQRAYKIDTSLVNPLGLLPTSFGFPENRRSLAERNLLRGLSMGLPSGQDVARAMGLPVISDDHLKVGKATEEDQRSNPRLVDLKDVGKEFAGKAPLWFYVLAEAQQQFKKNETPIRLGPVGGRIVAETFIGLLLADRHSFLSQAPDWAPNTSRSFTMADLIKKATS